MRIAPWILNTVCYVGCRATNGEFVPTGTGFVVRKYLTSDRYCNWIATAKHVVDGVRPEQLGYRINHADRVEVIPFDNADVVRDQSTDLALVPFTGDDQTAQLRYFMLDRGINANWMQKYGQLEVGDDIVTVGLYTSHYGANRNVPVARFGNIAALPGDPVKHFPRDVKRGLLVELRSVAGLSGSPVFKAIPPMFRKDKGVHVAQEADYQPIGILVGYHEVVSPEAILIEGEKAAPPPRGIDARDTNSGFGVVVPLEAIFELVERPDVVAQMNTSAIQAQLIDPEPLLTEIKPPPVA